jgi:hypothetical protein
VAASHPEIFCRGHLEYPKAKTLLVLREPVESLFQNEEEVVDKQVVHRGLAAIGRKSSDA